jgi:glycerol-3-phosphate dehydrogenase (NAD(P)+)
MSELIARDDAAGEISGVAVIGAGAFGTALACVLAENMPDREIMLWAHEKAVALGINSARQNGTWLPGVMLPDNVNATHNPAQALAAAQIVFLAVPSRFFAAVLQQIAGHLPAGAQLVSACRGFVRYNDTYMLPSECAALIAPGHAHSFTALNGPAHALEAGRGFHTRLVFGSASVESAGRAAALVQCGYITTGITGDVRGVELAAALKGPLGIAAGILGQLPHCGDNMLGILFSEGMREMQELAAVYGVDPDTLNGPAGAGDLVSSLTSSHCRNRRFGQELAANTSAARTIRRPLLVRFWSWVRRRSVIAEQAERSPYLVEGLFAIEPVIAAADREGLDVPVYRALHTILGGHPDHYLLLHAVTRPEEYRSFFEQYRVRASSMLDPEETRRSVIQKQALERTLAVFAEPGKALRLRQYLGRAADMTSTEMERLARVKLREYMRARMDLFGPVRHRLVFFALWLFNLMLHLFRRRRGRTMFSRNFRLVYDKAQLDPVILGSRIVYLAAGESAQDAVACLYALWRGGLPLPRVFREGTADFARAPGLCCVCAESILLNPATVTICYIASISGST